MNTEGQSMTNNQIEAESQAVAEFEDILTTKCNWKDGYGLTDTNIKQSKKPIFYRAVAPKAAMQGKAVVQDIEYKGQVYGSIGKTLYMVYRPLTLEAKRGSGNYVCTSVTMSAIIYYTDSALFDEESVFQAFLLKVLTELAKVGWLVSLENIEAAQSAGDESAYIYRKELTASKIF